MSMIMKQNIIKEKAFLFAIRIVKLSKYLVNEQKEFVLSKQILKSGTSIGANSEEADAGQSKKDFIAKMSISLKEAKETHYWLRLLVECDYINRQMFESLITDCNEIILILTRILQTARKNENKK
jgi:four helix bundle protein